ncbi:MAG: NAD(P)H dehydrogenase [Spirochaetales bacterium]|nr:MAG: NAD(P)H dehydrogenase [Spirochaetales bacterium]
MSSVSESERRIKSGRGRALLIIDHPWQDSFNFAIARQLQKELETAGVSVDFLDLHRENFDPVLRVEELAVYTKGQFKDPKVGAYQKRIEKADYLIFVFPVWWSVMPALLKGFADKVFLPQWAFDESDASPLLTHVRQAVVVSTMGAPEEGICTVEDSFCRGLLEFCGVRNWKWFNISEVSNISREERRAFLEEVGSYCRTMVI